MLDVLSYLIILLTFPLVEKFTKMLGLENRVSMAFGGKASGQKHFNVCLSDL